VAGWNEAFLTEEVQKSIKQDLESGDLDEIRGTGGWIKAGWLKPSNAPMQPKEKTMNKTTNPRMLFRQPSGDLDEAVKHARGRKAASRSRF